jgi:hypothetical protein
MLFLSFAGNAHNNDVTIYDLIAGAIFKHMTALA